MHKKLLNVLLSLLLFTGCFYVGVAKANILITPTLIVFDERDRFADVTLVNTSERLQSYKISWTYQKIDPETGKYVIYDAQQNEGFDLGEHVVFTPRQVRLDKRGKQKVRLALRRPAEIPPGDYYVYLKFEALSGSGEGVSDDGAVGKGVGASVQINISYAIPIILRVGEPDSSAKIGKIDLVRNSGNGLLDVNVPITRSEGPYGILGHLWVYHVADGSEDLVGEVSNANIFPDMDEKKFTVPLKKDIKGGALKLILRFYDKGNDYIYDEKVFDLE